ncbi:MAG: SMP-30/gluconolactonase/LRE family protein [Paracoccaceae bacterium]
MAAASEAAARLRPIGAQRDILGECPLWDDRAGVLWWVDIRRPAIRRLDPATGAVDTFAVPDLVGAIALTEGPRLAVAMGRAVSLWRPGSDVFEPLATLGDMPLGHRFNDGRVDRQGRFWVGTMHNLTRAAEGTLYRLEGGALVPVLSGIRIPNALAWSPEGSTMYFADSLSHGIDAFDLDPATGAPTRCRRFADAMPPAFPDGATTDTQGHLWYAEFNGGRVVRRAPDGRVSAVIETPVDRPTAVAFGGPDRRTLYITTTSQNMTEAERAAAPLAGALLAMQTGVAGLPEPRLAMT